MITTVIKWKGPYDYAELRTLDEGNGLYLLTGCLPKQRRDRVQYCGITEDTFYKRISQKNHVRENIRPKTLGIWIGEMVYPEKFGRSQLEIAEHCFIAFWQPQLNERKRVYCPNQEICLVSEWFDSSDVPRRKRPEILSDLPDVLWWDEERWRIGQLKVNAALD